nr:MAG TPA: hypothetical protein [Caudoviricetes sp.]
MVKRIARMQLGLSFMRNQLLSFVLGMAVPVQQG